MALQNLVSAAISLELKTSIMTKLNGLKDDLGFVVTILPEQKNEYLKVGNVMMPFLEKAFNAATAHPEILPSVFEKDEFIKDYHLTKELVPIANLLHELTSAVENTLYAANSDSMVEALEVYAAVQQNKDKVPGLDIIGAELKEFFKKGRKTATSPTPQN
jgi:hypothetical protein